MKMKSYSVGIEKFSITITSEGKKFVALEWIDRNN